MTSDPRPEAFSDQNGWRAMFLPSLSQCLTMGRIALLQRIGTPPHLFHIRVIESCHRSDSRQPPNPALHPGMRRRGTGSMGKEEEWRFHISALQVCPNLRVDVALNVTWATARDLRRRTGGTPMSP